MKENNNTENTSNENTQMMQRRLLYYAHHPQFINHRINQLDKETSLETMIENSSISLSLTGILLGVLNNRRWLILSLVATGLLFLKKEPKNNELRKLFRQQGYRSEQEILQERQILLVLRGDYDAIGATDEKPEDRVRQIVQSLGV